MKMLYLLLGEVLLSYFVDQAAKYAPSTLWATYSMLKSTISSKHNIDISRYLRLQAFLKKQISSIPFKVSYHEHSEQYIAISEAEDKFYRVPILRFLLFEPNT